MDEVCDYLATSRPTAVNLFWAIGSHPQELRRMRRSSTSSDDQAAILDEALAMLEEDKRVCRAIGEHGAKLLEELAQAAAESMSLLTHCNAGGLATVQYGTALAPIYVGASAA